jgi:hypothetical protein
MKTKASNDVPNLKSFSINEGASTLKTVLAIQGFTIYSARKIMANHLTWNKLARKTG